MIDKPKNPKMTDLEWLDLITYTIEGLNPNGEQKIKSILVDAIGQERTDRLIFDHADPKMTRNDQEKIIRGIYDAATGVTEAEKIEWALSVARKAFTDQARRDQIIAYATWHVINAQKEPEPSTIITPIHKEPIILENFDGNQKNRVDYSKMNVIDLLDYANIEGSGVRFNNQLPSSWWQSETNHMKFPRFHAGWYRNGRLFVGHFDWIRPGQVFKTVGNIGNGYMGERPPAGASIYFWIVSNRADARTDIVESKTKWR